MHHAVTDKFRIVQRGDHRKDALLLREFQVRLEADDVIDAALRVVAPELHHGIRLLPGLRVLQADGLQRPVAQRVKAAPRHDFNRHAALEDLRILEAVHLRLFGGGQRLDERGILVALHRAVDIICFATVIAGGEPGPLHVDGLKAHERRRRIKKAHIVRAAEIGLDRRAERVARQRASRDDDRPLRDLGHLALDHGDVRVRSDLLRHHAGKAVAVDGQRAAGLHAVGFGAL